MKYLVLIGCIMALSSCRKDNLPDQPFVSGHYCHCKVDGVDWYASKDGDMFSTKVSAQLTGDSVLLLAAYSGMESISIAVFSKPIGQKGSYKLSDNLPYSSSASYDNDLSTAHFTTDSIRNGQMFFALERKEGIIQGTFSFNAYHPVTHKTVSITDGFFSIEYQEH